MKLLNNGTGFEDYVANRFPVLRRSADHEMAPDFGHDRFSLEVKSSTDSTIPIKKSQLLRYSLLDKPVFYLVSFTQQQSMNPFAQWYALNWEYVDQIAQDRRTVKLLGRESVQALIGACPVHRAPTPQYPGLLLKATDNYVKDFFS